MAKTDPRLAKLIDSVAKEIRTSIKGSVKSAAAEAFARKFYANTPPDDLRGSSPADLVGASQSIRRLMQHRAPGEAPIRVYNPRQQTDGWTSPHTIIEIINDDMPFLVDSATAALSRLRMEVQLVIHPILAVKRGAKGQFQGLLEDGIKAGAINER